MFWKRRNKQRIKYMVGFDPYWEKGDIISTGIIVGKVVRKNPQLNWWQKLLIILGYKKYIPENPTYVIEYEGRSFQR